MVDDADSPKTRSSASKEGSSVDLGIADLLAELECRAELAADVGSGVAAVAPEDIVAESEPAMAIDQFADLAAKECWSELQDLVEKQLQVDSQDVATNLWWSLCQLKSGVIPASILTAPVDSALRGIDLDDASHVSLLPLVRQVGLMLAEKLIALDELELAQGILERSVALIPEAKGDIARVIQPLLDELAQFEREPPDSVAQKRRKERLAAIGLFAVSAELEVVPDAASDQAELGQSPKGIVNPVPVQHASHRRYGFRAVLGFGLVSFLVIAYFTVDPLAIIYDRQADVDVNVAMPYKVARLSGETEGPAMQLPELTRAAGVNDLDLILYEMDRAGKKGNGQSYNAVEQIAGVDKDPRLTAVVKSKQADGVTPKAESRVPQRKLAKRLESINTKLPLEGTRFRPPAVKRNPGPGANDGLYQSDVRDVDVRDFGKRDRSAKSKPKPVRSGNIYRIITRTSVMARPSYRALTLAVLQPGAHIEVTNRVDEWLAIRSQQGRSGYVLRQDAEVLP